MEVIKQALFSGNIMAWVILFVILVLMLKFLKSLGKGLVLALLILLLFGVMLNFYPDVVLPIVDYVGGGWMGD
ncbi:MAG: Na+/citrate or Na+/malate symporter [Lentimonas sp.]|jgi:Na+/citrate or Na+/malate symporter